MPAPRAGQAVSYCGLHSLNGKKLPRWPMSESFGGYKRATQVQAAVHQLVQDGHLGTRKRIGCDATVGKVSPLEASIGKHRLAFICDTTHALVCVVSVDFKFAAPAYYQPTGVRDPFVQPMLHELWQAIGKDEADASRLAEIVDIYNEMTSESIVKQARQRQAHAEGEARARDQARGAGARVLDGDSDVYTVGDDDRESLTRQEKYDQQSSSSEGRPAAAVGSISKAKLVGKRLWVSVEGCERTGRVVDFDPVTEAHMLRWYGVVQPQEEWVVLPQPGARSGALTTRARRMHGGANSTASAAAGLHEAEGSDSPSFLRAVLPSITQCCGMAFLLVILAVVIPAPTQYVEVYEDRTNDGLEGPWVDMGSHSMAAAADMKLNGTVVLVPKSTAWTLYMTPSCFTMLFAWPWTFVVVTSLLQSLIQVCGARRRATKDESTPLNIQNTAGKHKLVAPTTFRLALFRRLMRKGSELAPQAYAEQYYLGLALLAVLCGQFGVVGAIFDILAFPAEFDVEDLVLLRWEKLGKTKVLSALFWCAWLHVYMLVIKIMCPLPADESKEWSDQANPRAARMKVFKDKVGVVIPCHLSEKEIGNTLRSILDLGIPPENVAVIDNGNASILTTDQGVKIYPDRTKEIVDKVSAAAVQTQLAAIEKRFLAGGQSEEVYKERREQVLAAPAVIYQYISEPNKSRAMVEGALLLGHCDYILHVDDDTILPPGMIFDEEHFKDDRVAAVSYGIKVAVWENESEPVAALDEHLAKEHGRNPSSDGRTSASWSEDDTTLLTQLVDRYGANDWRQKAKQFEGREEADLRRHWKQLTYAPPAASCLPRIGGGAGAGTLNLTKSAVDFEYKLYNHMRYFRSETSTAWFCHGIIGLWRRDRFLMVWRDHPYFKWGEDGWFGIICMLHGWVIKQELRCLPVTTFSPPIMFSYEGAAAREQGYGAQNLWKQRARRWYTNQPRHLIWRMTEFLFADLGSFRANVIYRIELWRWVAFQTCVNVLWPFIVLRVVFERQWAPLAALYALLVVKEYLDYGITNYILWRHRPDYQVDLKTLLYMPFFQMGFLRLCWTWGTWECILTWWPWNPPECGMCKPQFDNAAGFRPAPGGVASLAPESLYDAIHPMLASAPDWAFVRTLIAPATARYKDSSMGCYALHAAAMKKAPADVLEAIAAAFPPAVDWRCKYDRTPLHWLADHSPVVAGTQRLGLKRVVSAATAEAVRVLVNASAIGGKVDSAAGPLKDDMNCTAYDIADQKPHEAPETVKQALLLHDHSFAGAGRRRGGAAPAAPEAAQPTVRHHADQMHRATNAMMGMMEFMGEDSSSTEADVEAQSLGATSAERV